MELRSLYEHLQARILELIETLGTLHASPDYEVFLFAEKDPAVIDTIAAAQQEELEKEIEELKAVSLQAEKEIEELVGSSPF
jgi:hypothetical protein